MDEVVCSCEEVIKIAFPAHQSSSTEPTLIQQILEGKLWSVECPQCQKLLKLEIPSVLELAEFSLKIQFLPEEQRSQYILKTLTPEKTAQRICIGYPELVEKVKILQSGLDDQVIEILKYFYLEAKGFPEDWKLFYHEWDKQVNKLVFFLQGLKPQEMGRTSVSFDLYEKYSQTKGKHMAQPIFKEFTTPPFVNVVQMGREQE